MTMKTISGSPAVLSLCLTLLLGGLLSTAAALAGDWPQILGPHRNGHADNESLASSWPAGGPKKLWRFQLGSGYAGPTVVDQRVIVFHRVGDQERIECLDAAAGKSQWKADFPASYRGGIDPDKGPRCVPMIGERSAFVFGASGDLHAVKLDSGEKLWSRSLYADYRGDEGYFGAGSTPILVANKLLVNVGARGAGLVALEPDTGKTAWQASDEAASYSSPTIAHIDGQDKALFVTRYNCVLADPADGRVTQLFPFGMRGPTVNAATPLVIGNKLFTTASYGVGAAYAALSDAPTKPLWTNDNTLSSQYATPVEHKGFLYGIHGREDQGVAELRCVEAATGKVQWKKTEFGVAHIILAGDKLLIQTAEGHLVLAAADPTKFRELASMKLPSNPARALPALASGRLYVRTGSGGGELLCFDVGQSKK